MMRRFFLALLLASALGSSFFPGPVFAAGTATCECFCGIPKYGAKSMGQVGTVSACSDACSGAGNIMVACAEDASQSPDGRPQCFKKDECADSHGRFDPNQPTDCLPGEHYCYSIGAPTALNVPISGVSSVADYGAYVNLAYKFLIGFMATIAIVMVMIGGLQYVLAAGSGDVSKAKARIGNAVVGLVLLLFSATILATVNPQLLSLRVPQLPMIKPIEFVQGSSCEYLQGYYGSGKTPYGPPMFNTTSPYAGKTGYTIEDATSGSNGAEVCGSIGKVAKDAEGHDVLDGTTCSYEYCGSSTERCVGYGDKAKCLSCTDVYPDSVPGLVPSEAICSGLSKTPPNGAGDGGFSRCYFTRDPASLISGWSWAGYGTLAAATAATGGGFAPFAAAAGTYFGTGDVETLYKGACAEVEFDCQNISSCGDYDNQQATVFGGSSNNEVDDLGQGGLVGSPVNIKTICQDNPCFKKIGACAYNEMNYIVGTTADCISQAAYDALRAAAVAETQNMHTGLQPGESKL